MTPQLFILGSPCLSASPSCSFNLRWSASLPGLLQKPDSLVLERDITAHLPLAKGRLWEAFVLSSFKGDWRGHLCVMCHRAGLACNARLSKLRSRELIVHLLCVFDHSSVGVFILCLEKQMFHTKLKGIFLFSI